METATENATEGTLCAVPTEYVRMLEDAFCMLAPVLANQIKPPVGEREAIAGLVIATGMILYRSGADVESDEGLSNVLVAIKQGVDEAKRVEAIVVAEEREAEARMHAQDAAEAAREARGGEHE